MVTITERPDGSRRVSMTFSDDVPEERSRTKPEFYKDGDINYIMKRYRKTGILGNPLNYKNGKYGDFSSGHDFAEVMRKVTSMRDVFDRLPAHVRARFHNDTRELVDFIVDPANKDEAIKLGLLDKPVLATPEPAPPVPPVVPEV